MIASMILSPVVIAAIALVSARLGDTALRSKPADPCAMIDKSPVVWAYNPSDGSPANPCAGGETNRPVSRSAR